MQSRLRTFGQFLHGEGIAEPGRVTELTMERYLAWGNARNAAGKNWYTDIVQLLRAAPVLLPGQWPRIALDKRAARRIRYKQAPDDPRNRLYASREGANRAAPPEALAAMVARLDELPAPIPVIYMIGVTPGRGPKTCMPCSSTACDPIRTTSGSCCSRSGRTRSAAGIPSPCC